MGNAEYMGLVAPTTVCCSTLVFYLFVGKTK